MDQEIHRRDGVNGYHWREVLLAAANLPIRPAQAVIMLRRHLTIAFADSIHFVTLVTRQRGDWFTSTELCHEILNSFERCRAKHELTCFGYVLMPDHLHALLRQHDEGLHVSRLVQDFKKYSSRYLRPGLYPDTTLWRTRYDDVPVPGTQALKTKLDYIHHNPVRRALVEYAEDYLWSSARDYAGRGLGIVQVTTDF